MLYYSVLPCPWQVRLAKTSREKKHFTPHSEIHLFLG